MIIIRLYKKSESSICVKFSREILIIPKITQFGFGKTKYWKNFIIDFHWLFLDIHWYVWGKKLEKYTKL